MDNEFTELQEALKQFRSELLNCFADLQVQIAALEMASLEEKPLTKEGLRDLQQDARRCFERFRERYAERLPFAHELR